MFSRVHDRHAHIPPLWPAPSFGGRSVRVLAVAALALLTACAPMPGGDSVSRAPVNFSLPPMRAFVAAPAPLPLRPNAQIAEDFLDLAFRMESGRPVPVLSRFEGPISVRVTGPVPPTLVGDLRALIARLNAEAGIDIFLTAAPEASITIEAVPQAELSRAVPRAACFVVPRIASWDEFRRLRRSPELDWTTLTVRENAAVFIPADAAPQEVRDCLHEELAQALGPLNDLYRLPDSVFNDDNMHAVLTDFDMTILRAFYSPALQSGMTRADVAARLPGILSAINPGGDGGGAPPVNDTSRDWIDAIETAVTGSAPMARRRASAEMALNLSRAFDWDGPRRGFSSYVYGRLNVGADPGLALAAFNDAARVYAATPGMAIQSAHVAVQQAAFALSSGDPDTVLTLVDPAIPVAEGAQNAALLATLLMFRAEALGLQGREAEAEAARLDSLAWARYGFGADVKVLERLRDVAMLTPRNQG